MASRLLFPVCGALLLAGADISTAQTDSQEEEQRVQQQKEQLQQRISRLQESIRKTRREKDALAAELADAEQQIGSLVAQLRELDAQQQKLQQRLLRLRRQQQDLQQRLGKTRDKLALLLRSAYMAGRQERLKLFLNQQDPAALGRLLAYHDYISRARARQLRIFDRDLQEKRNLAAQIGDQQVALEQLRERQREKKEALQQRQRQRRQLLQQVDSRLARQGEKLKRWQEDERRLTELLKHLREAFQVLDLPEQAGFRERKGKLIWPLRGKLLKTFGAQKIGNLRWDGVIISARAGEEVRAVHAGRVAWADWLRGYGLLIIVEHGDGFMTLYGHNQSLFKETGEWVEAGEAIAQASGGGLRKDGGIYFGIRHQGKALNPLRWCEKRGNGR
ncbi:murein hydrolase activator EnvC family protein [Thiolapillus sp.]